MRLLCLLLAQTLATPALALGGAATDAAPAGLAASAVLVLGDKGSACTGTVIGPGLVLTAAHCVEGSKQLAVAWFEGAGPKLVPVSGVARHPQANTGSAVSVDLALVRAAEPLPARFVPAPLDTGGEPHALGLERTLVGYGIANDGQELTAGTLRAATVPVLPKLLPRFLRLGAEAGGAQEGMAAFRICLGDSGGGVFSAGGVLIAVIAQRERLNGGRTCGPVAQAVRVAPQIGWIRGAMERLGR